MKSLRALREGLHPESNDSLITRGVEKVKVASPSHSQFIDGHGVRPASSEENREIHGIVDQDSEFSKSLPRPESCSKYSGFNLWEFLAKVLRWIRWAKSETKTEPIQDTVRNLVNDPDLKGLTERFREGLKRECPNHAKLIDGIPDSGLAGYVGELKRRLQIKLGHIEEYEESGGEGDIASNHEPEEIDVDVEISKIVAGVAKDDVSTAIQSLEDALEKNPNFSKSDKAAAIGAVLSQNSTKESVREILDQRVELTGKQKNLTAEERKYLDLNNIGRPLSRSEQQFKAKFETDYRAKGKSISDLSRLEVNQEEQAWIGVLDQRQRAIEQSMRLAAAKLCLEQFWGADQIHAKIKEMLKEEIGKDSPDYRLIDDIPDVAFSWYVGLIDDEENGLLKKLKADFGSGRVKHFDVEAVIADVVKNVVKDDFFAASRGLSAFKDKNPWVVINQGVVVGWVLKNAFESIPPEEILVVGRKLTHETKQQLIGKKKVDAGEFLFRQKRKMWLDRQTAIVNATIEEAAKMAGPQLYRDHLIDHREILTDKFRQCLKEELADPEAQAAVDLIASDALESYVSIVQAELIKWRERSSDAVVLDDQILDVEEINRHVKAEMKKVIAHIAGSDIQIATDTFQTACKIYPDISLGNSSKGYLLTILLKAVMADYSVQAVLDKYLEIDTSAEEPSKEELEWLELCRNRQATFGYVANDIMTDLASIVYNMGGAPKYLTSIEELSQVFPLATRESYIRVSGQSATLFDVSVYQKQTVPVSGSYAASSEVTAKVSEKMEGFVNDPVEKPKSVNTFVSDFGLYFRIEVHTRKGFRSKPVEINSRDGGKRISDLDEFIDGNAPDFPEAMTAEEREKARNAFRDSIKAMLNQGSITAILTMPEIASSFENGRYLVMPPSGTVGVKYFLTYGAQKGEFFLATQMPNDEATSLMFNGKIGETAGFHTILPIGKSSEIGQEKLIGRGAFTDIVHITASYDAPTKIEHRYLGGDWKILDSVANDYPA